MRKLCFIPSVLGVLGVLGACPAAPGEAQLIVSMDVYPHEKINVMLQLFHEILDLQGSCIGQEDL